MGRTYSLEVRNSPMAYILEIEDISVVEAYHCEFEGKRGAEWSGFVTPLPTLLIW